MNNDKESPSMGAPDLRVGGWRRLRSELVYENPWIALRHEEVLRPNGSEGIYGLVHFKNRAIGIVALDECGNTWLVKQSRYACNEYSYEIPEGGGPLDEEPLLAAQRELREETGLCADHWRLLLTLRTSNSVTDELAYVFVATGLTQGEQQLEETEDIEVIKLPFADALGMVDDGRITDAISVAALLKLARENSVSGS